MSTSGISRDDTVIVYGDNNTWFALKYLVGLDDVKNYDGSWTEYGNLVNAPVAK